MIYLTGDGRLQRQSAGSLIWEFRGHVQFVHIGAADGAYWLALYRSITFCQLHGGS